jgi:hypothetical protein
MKTEKGFPTDLIKEPWIWHIQKGRFSFHWEVQTRFGESFNEKVPLQWREEKEKIQGLTCCVAESPTVKWKGNGCAGWETWRRLCLSCWSSQGQLKEGARWRLGSACRSGLMWTPAEGVGDWSLEQRKKCRLLQADCAMGTASKSQIVGSPGYLETLLWNTKRVIKTTSISYSTRNRPNVSVQSLQDPLYILQYYLKPSYI